MIKGLTEEQFIHLPSTSLHYACDKCGKKRDYGSLMRDIADYSLVDGKVIEMEIHTALYLCSGCHWQMTCEYQQLDRTVKKIRQKMKETIDELAQILERIEAKHGTVQAADDYRYVKQLHEQARQCITTLRTLTTNSEEEDVE